MDKNFKDGEVILQESYLWISLNAFLNHFLMPLKRQSLNCSTCQDGEVFQTGKSFVYFIVKGEVEIWKVPHPETSRVSPAACCDTRKVTSSCCYSRVKRGDLRLQSELVSTVSEFQLVGLR